MIRKHIGYGYIAVEHAKAIDTFYQRWFNPYLNFHRPCGQPKRIVDGRGKETFVYRRYATPWENLRERSHALPNGESYLKPAFRVEAMDQLARAQSDTEAARRIQQAKQTLFLCFRQERKRA